LIPAIILTGDITLSGDTNAVPDNSLLLQKPARADELVQAINQLLGGKAFTNRDETFAE